MIGKKLKKLVNNLRKIFAAPRMGIVPGGGVAAFLINQLCRGVLDLLTIKLELRLLFRRPERSGRGGSSFRSLKVRGDRCR
jgi:hypothetical protein